MKLKNKNTKTEGRAVVELTDDMLVNVTGGANGRAMMKVAESYTGSTTEVLRPLKAVVNAENDTNTDVDRNAIQREMYTAI